MCYARLVGPVVVVFSVVVDQELNALLPMLLLCLMLLLLLLCLMLLLLFFEGVSFFHSIFSFAISCVIIVVKSQANNITESTGVCLCVQENVFVRQWGLQQAYTNQTSMFCFCFFVYVTPTYTLLSSCVTCYFVDHHYYHHYYR